MARKEKKETIGVAEALLDLGTETATAVETSTSTTPTSHDENAIDFFRDEYYRLLNENKELKNRIDDLEINQESFENDESKVLYYTGLPKFATLMFVFNLIVEFIPHGSMAKMTKFQKFIVVMMRLRLNLSVQDLAYRFGVSSTTISKTFKCLLHIMYRRLRRFIVWPEREVLRKTMPMSFKEHFGVKVACIIDCFEIFIERPSGLMPRAQTWSNYKHMNTISHRYFSTRCSQFYF